MKKLLSLILALLFITTSLVGCGGEDITPTEPVTEAPTVSEIDSQYEAGQKYMQEHKYADAITAFDRAIELDETRADVYVLRGDAYYELAQTENTADNLLSAVADYESAISKDVAAEDTKLYLCYVELGENAVNNDKKYDALTYYEKAYELDKSDPYVALVQRLWVYKSVGEPIPVCVTFDFDNTALFFYDGGGFYPDATYTVSGNSVRIVRDSDVEYNLEYNSEKGMFTSNGVELEKISAKDALTSEYTFYSELISQHSQFQNQFEMSQYAAQNYESWDEILNTIYDYVIGVLPPDEASALSLDQKDWIAEKESAINSISAGGVGASLVIMQQNITAADYTKERVKELIDMIPEP